MATNPTTTPESKTFTLLSSIPTGNHPGRTPITQCQAILENRMQCWLPGFFLVKSVSSSGQAYEYQLCRRHGLAEGAAEKLAQAAVQEGSKEPTKAEVKAPSKGRSISTFQAAPGKEKKETEESKESEEPQKIVNAPSDPTPAAKPLAFTAPKN